MYVPLLLWLVRLVDLKYNLNFDKTFAENSLDSNHFQREGLDLFGARERIPVHLEQKFVKPLLVLFDDIWR